MPDLLDRRSVGTDGKPFVSVFGIVGAAPAMAVGTHLIKGMRIFRAGSFANSLGERSDWTTADLDEMVKNFEDLRSRGILPNVPVRADHSRSVNNVVGYFTSLYREDDYLLADVELTEPDAVGKYERGTYRSRSAEIGVYVSNDEQVYWPVVMGVAFCDIPAVEGLHAAALSAFSAASIPATVLTELDAKPSFAGIEAAVVASFAALKADPANSDTRAFAARIVDAAKTFLDDSLASGVASDGANAQKGSGGASTDHANPKEGQVPTIKYSLGDHEIEVEETHKPALDAFANALRASQESQTALQAENATLKESLTTSEFARRDSLVDGWLKDGKIIPAQVEAQKAFCRTLSDEQFTAHSANVEATPKVTIATTTGVTQSSAPGSDEDKSEKVKQYQATVRMLFASGLDREKVLNSKAAKALIALGETVEE